MKKGILLGIIIFLLALLIDFVITLFSIQASGVYFSFFGMKIIMRLNDAALESVFFLTMHQVFWLLGFVSVFGFIGFLIGRKHKKDI